MASFHEPARGIPARPPCTRYDKHMRDTLQERRNTANGDWARAEVEQGRPDPKLRALMYSAVVQRNARQHNADPAPGSGPAALSAQQEYDRTLHHIIHYSVYDEHDDYMRQLEHKMAKAMNPQLMLMIQDQYNSYRRLTINEVTFYTNVAALLFSRPQMGMPGCMQWMDLTVDERVLVESYVEDNVATQSRVPPVVRSIEQQLASTYLQNPGRNRLPFFQELAPGDQVYGPAHGQPPPPVPHRPVAFAMAQYIPSYHNGIKRCSVAQLADLFVKHRLPVLGLMQNPLDGEAFLELLRCPQAELICTSAPPRGLGLSLQMFRGVVPSWVRSYE